MRSRSSSKQQSNRGAMDDLHNNKIKEEPHLSGAYIRSLVKQLTSSRPKGGLVINPKTADEVVVLQHDQDRDHGHNSSNNLSKFSDQDFPHQPQQPPPKKQVRRRLHTSRPYQERLLNMAEARREIVTALKFHRAAMKQANEQKQHQQQEAQSQSPPPPSSLLQREEIVNSQPLMNFNNNNNNICYSNVSSCVSQPNYSSYPYMNSPISPLLLPFNDNLNLPLPNQPLGLNLNFQDFNNIDTSTLYHNYPSIYSSYSSPSSSSSPPLSTIEEPHHELSVEGVYGMSSNLMEYHPSFVASEGSHHVMDDEEMAEMRSIGDQHQMEWNDTLDFVTSAWWFKFMKTMEIDGGVEKKEDKGLEDDGFQVFDEVMEFPAWMNNANDEHLDDCFSKDYLQEPALPCMDIGEIEGMDDGEWLA
ncbi:hypothetical protein Sjap_011965 [Stephania japonica]|uniref:Hydroxyproline-rich glycoprotein family protein n=1 Tax=Stephania japonica TaxID=461633 RepID=A0AAP0JEE9_9MAGN